MAIRDVDEIRIRTLELAVRNMLNSSRGKKPDDVFSNPDLLADYIADAFLVLRALEPLDSRRFLDLCAILSMKRGKSDVSDFVRRQVYAQMVEA